MASINLLRTFSLGEAGACGVGIPLRFLFPQCDYTEEKKGRTNHVEHINI